nr:hypothetical protein BaRGS_011067 [Batillaria attramentaria]
MTDSLYEELVARFAGPATVVKIFWTGKTLTAVIMGVEWMRRNKTVNILSGDRKSRAAAHHIKQQLEETARLVIGPQPVSRVRLHLVHLDKYGAELAANVDKLVKTLTSGGNKQRDLSDCR